VAGSGRCAGTSRPREPARPHRSAQRFRGVRVRSVSVTVSASRHRVAQIREVAIADSFALISGYSAEYLGRLLTGYPGGLERLLAQSGVPPDRRDDVLRAVGALLHVGANWRLEHEAGSGSVPVPAHCLAPPQIRAHHCSVSASPRSSRTVKPLRRLGRLRRCSALVRWPACLASRPVSLLDWRVRAPFVGNGTPGAAGSSLLQTSPRSELDE
jgi:hypothetical protein